MSQYINVILYNEPSPQCLASIISLMFSTARPPWHCQWVTCNPTISPPDFYNARYAGWPHPPVQLPYVTSPLSTARHVDMTTNIPSHPPQVNAANTRELRLFSTALCSTVVRTFKLSCSSPICDSPPHEFGGTSIRECNGSCQPSTSQHPQFPDMER